MHIDWNTLAGSVPGQIVILGVIARVFFLIDNRLKISHQSLQSELDTVHTIVNNASDQQRRQIQNLNDQLVVSKGKEEKDA